MTAVVDHGRQADRRAIGDTLVLTAGLAVAQAILWAALPLWSRIYGPQDFAQLGLWTAVVAIVSMLVLLRYDTTIVIARDEVEARALLRLCLALAAGGGVLLALLAAALPGRVVQALGLDPLGAWLPLAVVAGAVAAAFAALLAHANRHRRYARMTAARVLLALVAAALGIGLGGLAGGLLWGHLLAALLALPVLWPGRAVDTPAAATVPHAGPARAADASRHHLAAAARAHAAAPRYLWPSAMLDAVTQQLPMLLAVAWFSAHDAGQFSLAWRTAAVPVLMFAAAAGTVFYARFAAVVASGDVHGARALLLRQWRTFALAGLLPALLLAAAGGPVFAWLFGAGWREAGWLAAALAPMLLAMAVSSPTSGALIVLGLQKAAPLFGLAMLVYRPAALWLGAQSGSLVIGLLAWALCEVTAIVLFNRLLLLRLKASR
jgi:O-antigen/teichoic acid export membrane protein